MTRPAALPFVLLPGWGMPAVVWNGFAARLGPGRSCHALNLPGHGGADFAADQSDLDAWAAAALAHAPPRALWIGWSLGGLTALAAALRAPARVAGLFLIGATPRFIQAPDWPDAMPPERLDRFRADLDQDPAATLTRFLALQVRGGTGARDTLRQLKSDLTGAPAPRPAALRVGLELLRASDLRARLPELAAPTGWLFGTHDTLAPAALAPAIAALLPAARVQVLAGAAHAPQLSHPDETLQALGELLERTAP